MWHIVARAARGRWLFRSWSEGTVVWNTVLRAVPEVVALCVMPDHLHLLASRDVRARLGHALGGLARHRNAVDGVRGPLFLRLPHAVEVVGGKKQRRSHRYVHLNPPRAGLVTDPLAWPLSTHRDAVGLATPGVGPRKGLAFHDYVSRDEHTGTAATLRPAGVLRADAGEVVAAVSSVLRVPVERLGTHPLGRSLVWEAGCALGPLKAAELAERLRVSPRSLGRRVPVARRLLRQVEQVAGDARFGPLDDGLLIRMPAWQRYAATRGLPVW